MVVHEVRVTFDTPLMEMEQNVYLSSAYAVREFRKIAEKRGWKTGDCIAYVAGDVERAVYEIEREIELAKRIAEGGEA